MAPKKAFQEPVVEDIPEDEAEEDEEEEEEDFEPMDLGGVLEGFFATEDGDNVCTALVNISNSLAQMTKLMDTQNKIMLKMLNHLQKQS
jgi:hypothetical protein